MNSEELPKLPKQPKEVARELFLAGQYPEESHSESSPVWEHYFELEESFFDLLRQSEIPSSPFSEALDTAKAEALLRENALPLPAFLQEYTRQNLTKPVKKDNLIFVVTKKGINMIDSLVENLQILSHWELLPATRAASTDFEPETSNSVIFEETSSDNQKFYYQIVKENESEVYLSVKAEAKPSFQQVNLRRDGRFILSGKVNPDGTVSFSGLTPGNYTIEFLGSGQSKSFDLSILLG